MHGTYTIVKGTQNTYKPTKNEQTYKNTYTNLQKYQTEWAGVQKHVYKHIKTNEQVLKTRIQAYKDK